MNKLSKFAIFILLVLGIVFNGVPMQIKAANTNPNLTYFSYWGNWGQGLLNETTNYSNLAWVNYASMMPQVENVNMEAIIPISYNWFNHPCGLESGTSEYDTWVSYVESMAPYIDNIAAILVVDDPSALSQPWDTIISNLECTATFIKQFFPNTNLWVNFGPELDYDGYDIPHQYNWVSFNCYGRFNSCDNGAYGPFSVSSIVSNLSQKLSSNQKILLIPQSFTYTDYDNWNLTESELVTLANQYYDLAQSNSNIIGIIPFTWIGTCFSEFSQCAQNLPLVKSAWASIADSITDQSPILPTISIDTPTTNTMVADTITISATATDLVGVKNVQFKIDGYNIGNELIVAPYTLTYDTNVLANGSHVITAVATNLAGNQTTSSPITITIGPIINSPTIIFFVASPGTITSGESTVLSWSVLDTTSLSISPTVGLINNQNSGSVIVSPSSTTSYVISASNNSGTVTRSLIITVDPYVLPTPEPTPTPTPEPTPNGYIDGQLFNDNGTIFIVEDGKKRGFTSMEVLLGLGYNLSRVVQADISELLEGEVVSRIDSRHTRGSLVLDEGTVYFMGSLQRYPFPSAEVFLSWGNKFENIVIANNYDILVPIGPIAEKKPEYFF